MIDIREAITKKEMRDFVMFPFSLYKHSPYWIPPLINEELAGFDRTKNPAFEKAEAHFYLAYRDEKIVGRIVAIVNWQEVNELGKKKVRFGWFDVIDDIDVTKALLEKVYEFGRMHGMDHAEGPMGFSNLDKVGALTEGFDQVGTMITWYNYPYYVTHFEQLGFRKEKEFLESRFDMPDENQVAPYLKGDALIRRRYGLKLITPKSVAEILPYIDPMFDLFNSAYAKLSSFVAVTERQKEYFKNKYIGLINPEYILFVEDTAGKMVGFSIVMPSLSKALQKSGGRLLPFGWLRLLWAKKHNDTVLFYLIGVHPEYQNKGITAMIMSQYFRAFNANGVTECIRTPELEENHPIHNLWKNFNPVVHKRRCTYLKNLF